MSRHVADDPAPALRLGTLLPTRELAIRGQHDPGPVLDLARSLEATGVDSLWVGESVTARPRPDVYAMLAAVAAVTHRVTVGSAVLLPSLRNPTAFAHQVATIDRLAAGRLVLGLGAGFPGPDTDHEYATLGADARRRVSGIERTLDAARDVWGGDGQVVVAPRPARPEGPPTWLATATPGGLERCGRRHDGWLPYPNDPEEYRTGLLAIRRSAAEAGRDPEAITPGLYVTVATGVDAERRMEEYCRAYYGAGPDLVGLVQAVIAGSVDRVVSRLADYVAAGARHLVIRHATLDVDQVRDEAVLVHEALRAG